MAKTTRFIVCLGAWLVLSGCALIPGSDALYDGAVGGKVYSWEWGRPMRYGGFFLEVGPGFTWFLLPEEQSSYHGVFRMGGTDTLSKYIAVNVYQATRTFGSPEDLADYAKPIHVTFSERGELLSYESEAGTPRSPWCIAYTVRALDHEAVNSPDQPLMMVNFGEFCRHPSEPGILVDLFYSERGLEGEVAQELPDEAASFLSQIYFDPPRVIPSTWAQTMPPHPYYAGKTKKIP